MGLPPLEYLECYLDSPSFRENIRLYERELNANSEKLKALLKECRQMIKATEDYSRTLTSFATVLGEFSFETEGSEKSDEERMLASSLTSFSETLLLIEESRTNLITTMTHRLVKNLEKFRKENIHSCKEEKKKFDRATERYYQFMDKFLSQSQKKGAPLPEYEDQLVKEQLSFQQASFQYVCMVQDLHAQKQYELMEPIIGYFHDITAFFHQAYDAASSLSPFVEKIQHKVQLLREVFLDCQNKRYALKTAVLAKAQEMVSQHPEFKRQGHLMVHERKGSVLQSGWVRYFAQFRKNEDVGCIGEVKLVSLESRGNLPRDFVEVKKCIRCRHDDVDRRYCMELELVLGSAQEDPMKKYTVQAMNQDDRQKWMDAMEGKEPIYFEMGKDEPAHHATQFSEASFIFIDKCIAELEQRGLREEGMYRKPGQVLKATKLMKDAVEKRTIPDISDENEWETHILCSAIKFFFSKQLEEPLLTFHLHKDFLEAGKLNDASCRKDTIVDLVSQLPPSNKKMLRTLIEHLSRVAALSDVNLMKPGNLGVCFGPTLMRPLVETVATIADLKHQNKVIEVLIVNVTELFSERRVAPSDDDGKDSTGLDEQENKSSTEELRDSSSPFNRQLSASVYVSTGSDAARGVLRSGSVPSPKTTRRSTVLGEEKGKHSAVNRPKLPTHPHPQRPPPPPPDKPTSIVKQRSAIFQRTAANGPRKPKVPPFKPSISPGPSAAFVRNRSPDQCEGREDSNRLLDDNEKVPESPANLPPSDNQTKLSEKEVVTSSKEQEAIASGKEEVVTSPKEEEVFNRLWNIGRRAVALYDCESEDPGELSFKKNDILLNVTESEEEGWYSATLPNEVTGLVPFNYIKILQND